MAGDLENLMAQAAGDLEAAVPPVPSDTLTHLRTAVRQRRLRRHATESVGALAVVGALAAAATLGTRYAPEPAVTPTPTTSASVPSPTPTPTPTATADPAPTGPVVRADDVDDATVLARVAAPRTGEVWTTPTPVDALAPLFEGDDGTVSEWYLVGHRGDAAIYAVSLSSADASDGELRRAEGNGVALVEQDATGLRQIDCPSSRGTDACAGATPYGAVAVDTTTFYDSLTLPRALTLPGGYTVTTTASTPTGASTGSLAGLLLDDETRTLATFGPVRVEERTIPSSVPDSPAGLRHVVLVLRTAWGGSLPLASRDVPGGDDTRITWDDGVVRSSGDTAHPWTTAPGSATCDFAMFSVETDGHETAAWQPTGTLPDGRRVYTPAPGHEQLAATLRDWHHAASGGEVWVGGDQDGEYVDGRTAYPFPTVEQFLDARALFAFQGPGGQWLLGMRGVAASSVYECN